MQIGTAIKELRVRKGFKQVEFAELSGLSQSYLSLIEKGRKEPTLGTLKQVAKVLEVPMPVLVFFSLEEIDVDESKRGAFNLLESTIKGLMSDVFMPEPESTQS